MSHGLELIEPAVQAAHPLDGGRAAVLHRSLERDGGGPRGRDGAAYADLVRPFARGLGRPRPDRARPAPPAPPSAARRQVRAVGDARRGRPGHGHVPVGRGQGAPGRDGARTRCCRSSARRRPASRSSCSRSATPWAGRSRAAARRRSPTRWPRTCARSAARSRPATRCARWPTCRGRAAVLLDVTPRQLVSICGDELPAALPGGARPLPLRAGRLQDRLRPHRRRCRGRPRRPAGAGTVHVGGTLEEIAASEATVVGGGHPERPFVLVAQQSLVDPGARTGGPPHAVGVLPRPQRLDGRHDRGDRAPDRALRARLPRRSCSRASVRGPAELEADNPNYVGGDINGGAADLRQMLARPVLRASPYATPNPRHLPLLVVDPARRRRPRHVRLPRRAGGAGRRAAVGRCGTGGAERGGRAQLTSVGTVNWQARAPFRATRQLASARTVNWQDRRLGAARPHLASVRRGKWQDGPAPPGALNWHPLQRPIGRTGRCGAAPN